MSDYTKDKLIELTKKIDFLIELEFKKMKAGGEIPEEKSYEDWYKETFPKYKTTEGSAYDLSKVSGRIARYKGFIG